MFLARVGQPTLGARAGKFKFGARVGKYILGARSGKYKFGARAGIQGRGMENANTLKLTTNIVPLTKYYLECLRVLAWGLYSLIFF